MMKKWAKKQGYYLWLLTSSKRMNQFAWFWHSDVLFWTHLLTNHVEYVTSGTTWQKSATQISLSTTTMGILP